MPREKDGRTDYSSEAARIERDFVYHPPKPGQPAIYQMLRTHARALAYTIDENVPAGREKSLALTRLEEVVMWANAGIARDGAHGAPEEGS